MSTIYTYIQYREVGKNIWLQTENIEVDDIHILSAIVTDLNPETVYEYRAVVDAGELGIYYGDTLQFVTESEVSECRVEINIKSMIPYLFDETFKLHILPPATVGVNVASKYIPIRIDKEHRNFNLAMTFK